MSEVPLLMPLDIHTLRHPYTRVHDDQEDIRQERADDRHHTQKQYDARGQKEVLGTQVLEQHWPLSRQAEHHRADDAARDQVRQIGSPAIGSGVVSLAGSPVDGLFLGHDAL